MRFRLALEERSLSSDDESDIDDKDEDDKTAGNGTGTGALRQRWGKGGAKTLGDDDEHDDEDGDAARDRKEVRRGFALALALRCICICICISTAPRPLALCETCCVGPVAFRLFRSRSFALYLLRCLPFPVRARLRACPHSLPAGMRMRMCLCMLVHSATRRTVATWRRCCLETC
jgi:hypothetical protein